MQQYPWSAIALGAIACSLANVPAAAQIVPATDGIGTAIVVHGNRIEIGGGTRAGANLLHSFQQFGLDAGQIATFLAQPDLANILARVTGGQASVIDGLLQVTGGQPNLYLMNPAGIILGSNARLNVPGDFFATTATAIGLDSGGWFNALGPLALEQLTGTPAQFAFDLETPAPLVNAGHLQVNPGQSLTLLAGQVINTGHLQAPGGSIVVSAVPGSSLVRLSQPGHALSLEIEPPRTASGDLAAIAPRDLPELLTGSGVATGLTATGQRLQFSASGQSVNSVPGLAAISGRLEASHGSEAGGHVAVLGDRVALFGAELEASGATGGGQILVGGDYQGRGSVPNARRTLVDADSTLRADALATGDGGRVILWADEATGFWGEISARGGPQGGAGGFVEVSGKQQLVFEGNADLTATAGPLGTLLLDPFNIFIVEDNGPDDSEISDGEILLDDAPGSTLTISADELEDFTGAELILEAANDIIVAAGVDLVFDEDVSSIELIADADGDGRGAFSMSSDSRIETNGADLAILGAAISLGGILTESDARPSGSVVLIASSRETDSNITFSFIDTSNDSGFAGGDVAIVAGGKVRGTSTNAAGNTIDTRGDAGGGSILISYSGGPLGLPFIVGDASQNGVAGSLVTNSTAIRPTQAFRQPGLTLIGDIAFNFTGFSELAGLDDDLLLSASTNNSAQPDVTEIALSSPLADNTAGALDPGFAELDLAAAQEFLNYLEGIPAPETLSLAQQQEALQTVADQTGQVPVIVYVRYVPAIAQQPAPAPTALTPGAQVATAPRELWHFEGDTPWTAFVERERAQAALEHPEDTLEVAVVFPSGPPVRRLVSGATRAKVEPVVNQFRRHVTSPQRRDAYRASAQQLYQWFIAPVEDQLQARGVTNLAFVLAAGLRSLPVAALFDGEQFLIERYSLGLMPSLSLTDTRYRPVQDLSVLAMGASEFAEQPPLPAVPLELEIIARELWPGETFLNQAFTLNNLKTARAQDGYGIVHLGTHGEFQPGRLDQSFLWLGDNQLPLSRLRELSLNQPPTELLVLSACRTALGDREAELGFAGLAVQSGVKSALGSLWYVSDAGTLAFMTSFYEQLRGAPIKAEALRQAQLALLRGDTRFEGSQLLTAGGRFAIPSGIGLNEELDLRHPYYWSAFTLIGSPW